VVPLLFVCKDALYEQTFTAAVTEATVCTYWTFSTATRRGYYDFSSAAFHQPATLCEKG